MLLGIRWGRLRTKIIIWSFVPAAIILGTVALVTYMAYQPGTEDLASSQRYGGYLLVLLVLGLVVPAIVVALGVRRLTRPISELIDAAGKVAGGDLGYTIDVETGDEIEELAGQFNLMSEQLQASYSDPGAGGAQCHCCSSQPISRSGRDPGRCAGQDPRGNGHRGGWYLLT